MTFKTYFKDQSSHPNIVHVACNNLSQVNVTQTLRPKNAVIFSHLIPMILKIDMFPWWLPYLAGGCQGFRKFETVQYNRILNPELSDKMPKYRDI